MTIIFVIFLFPLRLLNISVTKGSCSLLLRKLLEKSKNITPLRCIDRKKALYSENFYSTTWFARKFALGDNTL